MPDYSPRISELKKQIETALLPLIDNDYVLLDIPLYNNIGDVLLWQGTLDFLRTVPHRRLAQGCFKTWNFPDLRPGTVILLSGGGNFGDLYPQHQNFRFQVLEHYPQHRIIVLPQSIHYDHGHSLEEDLALMRRHCDLRICVRDQVSFEVLRHHLPSGHLMLLPDMAFCLDLKRLDYRPRKALHPLLFIERTDTESTRTEFSKHPIVAGEVNTQDWPGAKHATFCQWLMARMRSCRKIIGSKTAIVFADRIFRPYMLRLGIAFLNRYEHIYTTRLHAGILSVLLGKTVTVLDNSYGKNSRFFKTWFADSGIEIIENRPAAMCDQQKQVPEVSDRPANRTRQSA